MGRARDYMPALRYGAKIYPEDVAGILGLPSVGNVIYVDPTAGSDTANNGSSQDSAFATVGKAYASAVSGNHDVILVAPTGGTGRTTEAAAISWAKRFTHLIGSAAPTITNARAGMSFSDLSGGTCFTMTSAATGCIFQNLTIASFADNNVLFQLTGANYNYFGGVHFAGIGNDTTGDDTAARSLVLSAAGENTFETCTIGLDTITRSAANASLELTGSCPRNVFRDCLFPAYCDNAGVLFVKATTGNCNERFLIFDRCLFLNAVDGSSTTMTVGMSVGATGNGVIFMRDCWMRGATDMCNTYTNVYVTNPTVNTANQTFPVIAAT